jgi:hypothetical protein
MNDQTANTSVNKKFIDPCRSLIFKGLSFEAVVPPAPKVFMQVAEWPIRANNLKSQIKTNFKLCYFISIIPYIYGINGI